MELKNDNEEIFQKLFEIEAIKEGEFTFTSGIKAPLYIDLRRIISFPEVYQHVIDLIWQEMMDYEMDHVSGVPLAGVPLASGIALLYHKSMVMPRKESKKHGMRQRIEGAFKKGDEVVLIEDLVTSGGSALDTVKTLREAGLVVNNVVAFLDYEKGAPEKLADHDVQVRTVCKLSELIGSLHRSGKIDASAFERINTFMKEKHF